MNRGYMDSSEREDASDSGGSGTAVNSPVHHQQENPDLGRPYLGRRSLTTWEKYNRHLLLFSFGLSSFILFLAVTTASENTKLLTSLHPYAADLANNTNKTWGYGGMPVDSHSEDRKMGGHHHGDASATTTALSAYDTAILMKDTWKPVQGNDPMSIFPITSDTLDEQRPDEVVTYDHNFLVKKHVSTVLQYNRRISANESYRTAHRACAVQAYMPPYQTLANNKTLITSGAPMDIWLLEGHLEGPWWAGKDFIKNGRWALRTDMTWNKKLTRKQKLGTLHAWPGVNMNTGTFECPKIESGRKGERIAVELACTPGPTEESCFLAFDFRMTYPVLVFEVVF